ncbi:hypothetical protein WJX84_006787 [Apatococcus fuscideae]|uniref:Carboxypeptidase n=1 Tax=Apatococcus fuscideae TaxID=2026836 RepID=A0AAW1SM91_9CHLO
MMFPVIILSLLGSACAFESRLSETPVNFPGIANQTDLQLSASRVTAGYYKLDHTHEASMFYLYVKARASQPEKQPLVLWMTGGPGCSSELAFFYENGPYHITENLGLELSEYGWDVNNNMIYVDQPINTGFSYSEDARDTIYNEHGVAADMLDFMHAFFAAHPELIDNPLYITGESYAGHYVPAVSYAIFKHNLNVTSNTKINLKGLAVGNGLTDPAIQYGAYADYALHNGLIGSAARNGIKAVYPICQLATNLCNSLNLDVVCLLALQFCQDTQFGGVMLLNPGMNVYDIRKDCVGPLCYDFSRLDAYLAQPDVRKALGVGDRSWTECNTEVNAEMMGDWMKNYEPTLPPMLDAGIEVMIYAGVEDLICNYLGNQRWVDALPWTGSAAWAATDLKPWLVDGSVAGEVKQAQGLTFVKVAGAGHMVPMDQPKNSLVMLESWIQKTPFNTSGPSQAFAKSLPAWQQAISQLTSRKAGFFSQAA